MFYLDNHIQFDYTLKLVFKRFVYERKNYNDFLLTELSYPPSLRTYTIVVNTLDSLKSSDLELLKLSQEELNKRIENYIKNDSNYVKLKFYDLKRNEFKNQVYVNNKYLLTTDKLNNDSVEFDYNLFRKLFNYSQEDIKEVLRELYTVK